MTRKPLISNIAQLGPATDQVGASSGRSLTVVLEDGSEAHLNPEDARSERFSEILRGLKELRHPVYLEVDSSTAIIDRLLVPIIGRVVGVDEVETGLEVELASSHLCYTLRADAADFKALEVRLREMKETGELVVVVDDDDHSIIDVRPYVPGVGGPPVPFDVSAGPLGPRPKPWSWLPRPIRLLVEVGWPWHWTSMSSVIDAFAVVRHRTCDPVTAPAPCIPFMYPDDGCWARAHEMCRLMIDMGLKPSKVWIRSADTARLTPGSKNSPSCEANWWWHCAPTLVARSGMIWFQRYVIDPALFSEPVTVATWKAALKDPNAALTDSDASEYMIEEVHRYVSNLSRTDPNYAETNYYLSYYRLRLMVRAAAGNGPPFAYCP